MVAVIVPAAHAVADVLPVAHAEPAGHVVQSLCDVAPGVARKLPASHSNAALAPSAQCEPAGHCTHAVAPLADWYVPAAQLAHVDALSWSLNVPGAQLVGVSEPTEQNVPVGQITQSSTDVITVSDVFLCVPPGQGSGAAEPSEQ